MDANQGYGSTRKLGLPERAGTQEAIPRLLTVFVSRGRIMSSLRQPQIDAAKEFVNTTVKSMQTDRGVHAETAVAGAARMAGTFLFRSFGFSLKDVEPGQPVLSEQANEIGPRLVEVLCEILPRVGLSLDPSRLGGTPGPENQPQQSFLETQKLLEPKFSEIRIRHGLSEQEAAESGAVATAIIMRQTSQALDPHVAFGIAVYAFIEGTKTAPGPVAML